MLAQEQLKQYLDRIDYHAPLALNEDTLSALQWAHLTHIPYENLDILAGVPLSLEPEDLFQKIILRRRGGATALSSRACSKNCWRPSASPSSSTPPGFWTRRDPPRCGGTGC